MKTFYQLRQELTSEDTSEVEIMPEINSDTDDPKELKKKKAKKQKETKQKVATESYDKKKAKKAKKDHDGDGKVESGKAEYFGSKDKAIKKAMKKEDSTYGYDKKGNSLNPKDMAKAKKKKGCSEDRVQELRNEVDRILTELGEVTETTYTITGEKWDTDEVLVSNEDEKAYNLEEWKKAAKKKAKKIMSYSKGGY